jgi:hypothetical protein
MSSVSGCSVRSAAAARLTHPGLAGFPTASTIHLHVLSRDPGNVSSFRCEAAAPKSFNALGIALSSVTGALISLPVELMRACR